MYLRITVYIDVRSFKDKTCFIDKKDSDKYVIRDIVTGLYDGFQDLLSSNVVFNDLHADWNTTLVAGELGKTSGSFRYQSSASPKYENCVYSL